MKKTNHYPNHSSSNSSHPSSTSSPSLSPSPPIDPHAALPASLLSSSSSSSSPSSIPSHSTYSSSYSSQNISTLSSLLFPSTSSSSSSSPPSSLFTNKIVGRQIGLTNRHRKLPLIDFESEPNTLAPPPSSSSLPTTTRQYRLPPHLHQTVGRQSLSRRLRTHIGICDMKKIEGKVTYEQMKLLNGMWNYYIEDLLKGTWTKEKDKDKEGNEKDGENENNKSSKRKRNSSSTLSSPSSSSSSCSLPSTDDFQSQILHYNASMRRLELLLRADWHGSFLRVISSSHPSNVGIEGILLVETAETMNILRENDKIVSVMKRGNVFEFTAIVRKEGRKGNQNKNTNNNNNNIDHILSSAPLEDHNVNVNLPQPYRFEVVGDHVRVRAAERSAKKFKIKF